MPLMQPTIYYAHSLQGQPVEKWEPLEDHLELVADYAENFAKAFGSGAWGRLAGLWHDLGKYSLEFQDRLLIANGFEAHLENQPGRVDHSTAGAKHAMSVGAKRGGRLLAWCIAGHHGGLLDTGDLDERLIKAIPDWSAAPKAFVDHVLPAPPPLLSASDPQEQAFRIALWCRMLFSALVDADFLATEQFMRRDRSIAREYKPVPMADLERNVLQHIAQKSTGANPTPVNRHRADVLAACLAKAELKPGLFSLSVPTGGGKTLASLAFALKHARMNELRRVIYAIPFTSIIEQNADVFRDAMGPYSHLVLEHHSNLEPRHETAWSRLAGENWDAPVVVTTNVQLFESLFADRTSRCRKLHRLAKSVIVLDEAQTIPVEVLSPCLAVLRELAECYGATIILCTATRPAVHRREKFDIGLENVTEIIDHREILYAGMRRVETSYLGKLDDVELVKRLSAQKQALCIVNTRAHAAKIYAAMPDRASCVHLSALMCPNHRSEAIEKIKQRLKQNQPCVVISTQLVEAGVDLDFPVVYRAMTGADSIAQAAGRCNREGKLQFGRVYVFEPEASIPPTQRHAADSARDVIGRVDDLLGPDAVEEYFLLHYWRRSNVWDKENVMQCFKDAGQLLNFREAAAKFKIIKEDGQMPVIVPWGQKGEALGKLITTSSSDADLPFDIHRRAQRFIVQIHANAWQQLVDSGAIALYGEGGRLPLLMNLDLYDNQIGLLINVPGAISPENLTL